MLTFDVFCRSWLRLPMLSQLLSISFLCFKYMGQTWPSNRPGGSGTVYVLVLRTHKQSSQILPRDMLCQCCLDSRLPSSSFAFLIRNGDVEALVVDVNKWPEGGIVTLISLARIFQPGTLAGRPTCYCRWENPPQWEYGSLSPPRQPHQPRVTGWRRGSGQTWPGSPAILSPCWSWTPCPGRRSLIQDRGEDRRPGFTTQATTAAQCAATHTVHC